MGLKRKEDEELEVGADVSNVEQVEAKVRESRTREKI